MVGASLDAVFLIGIATTNTFLALVAFVTLLAVSTNVARGPFQGYVPDMVPGPQVGFASALVGLMQVVGNILGFGLAPNVAMVTVAAALFGASQGTFLAVDGAFMADIIPKASAGRYMGLSNVATQSSTTLAVIIGGLIITAMADMALGAGMRVVLVLGIAYFLAGALALRPVVEPKRVRT